MALAKDPHGSIKPVVIVAADTSGAAAGVIDTQPDTDDGVWYSTVSIWATGTLASLASSETLTLGDIDITSGTGTAGTGTAVDSNGSIVAFTATGTGTGAFCERIATYDLASRERYIKVDVEPATSGSATWSINLIGVLGGPNKKPLYVSDVS